LEGEKLTETVIGCAMKVHRALGAGFLESVYKKALMFELERAGLVVEIEKPLQVFYGGDVVGDFYADLVVEGFLILELKAASALSKADEQQLVNYLTATKSDYGLLLNFGASSLEFQRKYRKRSVSSTLPVNPRNPANPV
jgi:GxxExxY protein